MCTDGSYCCNNDATCCSKKNGKFLDSKGNIISNPYATNTPATGTSPAAAVAAATTVHAAPTTSASNSRRGLSATAEGVIGALAGVLLLTLIAAGLFVCMKRRQIHSLKADSMAKQSSPEVYHSYQHDPKSAMGFAPAEMGGADQTSPSVRRELASELEPSRMSA